MMMTVKQLREYLETVDDQDMNVCFYQYEETKLLAVQEEEISVELVHRSPFDGKLRIVPPSTIDEFEQVKKALIFT
jgi:hypothetical protein